MTYQQDIEYSADALDEALKSVECAINILPARFSFEKTLLRKACVIIGNVRAQLTKPRPTAHSTKEPG